MCKSSVLAFLLLAFTTVALAEDNYTGTYMIEGESGPITVALKQDAQGKVPGTMADESMELWIQGNTEP